MKQIIIFFLIIIHLGFNIKAQELNAQIIINSDLVNQTNQQIFKTLERALNEFINTQVWTNKEFLNQERISWSELSENPEAIHLLEKHYDKIDWENLSRNPSAIKLIERNLDKVNWDIVSMNKNAIHLLKPRAMDGYWMLNNLEYNPEIFEIDYLILQQKIEPFKEELIQKCFHPNRLFYYLETYNYDIGDDEYLNINLFK